jgi:hypothetical protein
MTRSSSRETVDETLRSSQEALNRLHDVLTTTETRLRVSRRLLERPGDAHTERSDSETHERWVPPMNANVAPTHWQRTHANRWVAEVTATPGGGYKYSAHDSAGLSTGRTGHAADLARAQELADAKVPNHECGCEAWLVVR